MGLHGLVFRYKKEAGMVTVLPYVCMCGMHTCASPRPGLVVTRYARAYFRPQSGRGLFYCNGRAICGEDVS